MRHRDSWLFSVQGLPSAAVDLTVFCRLDVLGREVTGQRGIERDRAVLACRITADDRWCRHCGDLGRQSRAALSRCALQWALKATVCQHLSVARVAEGLAVSGNTPKQCGPHRRSPHPHHRSGPPRRPVRHCHHRSDPDPRRDRPAHLLDMIEGGSKKASH